MSNPRDLPVIPPLPPHLPNPDPNPPIARCGECGLVLHQVMHYYCPNPRCPCFPRFTCSTSSDLEPSDREIQATYDSAFEYTCTLNP